MLFGITPLFMAYFSSIQKTERDLSVFKSYQFGNDLSENMQPEFLHSDQLLFSREGGTLVLNCRVINLSIHHTVSWLRLSDFQVMSVGSLVFTSDPRIEVLSQMTRSSTAGTWTLRISPAIQSDSSEYQCQVNTDPTSVFDITVIVEPNRKENVPANISSTSSKIDSVSPKGPSRIKVGKNGKILPKNPKKWPQFTMPEEQHWVKNMLNESQKFVANKTSEKEKEENETINYALSEEIVLDDLLHDAVNNDDEIELDPSWDNENTLNMKVVMVEIEPATQEQPHNTLLVCFVIFLMFMSYFIGTSCVITGLSSPLLTFLPNNKKSHTLWSNFFRPRNSSISDDSGVYEPANIDQRISEPKSLFEGEQKGKPYDQLAVWIEQLPCEPKYFGWKFPANKVSTFLPDFPAKNKNGAISSQSSHASANSSDRSDEENPLRNSSRHFDSVNIFTTETSEPARSMKATSSEVRRPAFRSPLAQEDTDSSTSSVEAPLEVADSHRDEAASEEARGGGEASSAIKEAVPSSQVDEEEQTVSHGCPLETQFNVPCLMHDSDDN